MQSRVVGLQPCVQRGSENAIADSLQYAVRIGQQWHPVATPWRNVVLLQHMFERVMVRPAGQHDAFAALPRMDA